MASKLIVYGHQYCPEVYFLRSALHQHGVEYEWRDVAGSDPGVREELRAMARGYLSVPTVILPDGEVLVEPNPRQVLDKLKQSV